jgi:hypothetical protein
VHVVLTVTQFSPVETVIVALLMPVVVKATDRVVAALAARVTAAVVESSVIARPVCVTYPALDAV